MKKLLYPTGPQRYANSQTTEKGPARTFLGNPDDSYTQSVSTQPEQHSLRKALPGRTERGENHKDFLGVDVMNPASREAV